MHQDGGQQIILISMNVIAHAMKRVYCVLLATVFADFDSLTVGEASLAQTRIFDVGETNASAIEQIIYMYST